MKRAFLIAVAGAAFIGALGAGQAQADTYCANLPADTSCDQNFNGTTTSIQLAVEKADLHAGPDSVKVGPGTFVMSSPVYLSGSGDDNQLTLTGSGPATILQGSDPVDPDIHFNAPAGSSINSLTVSVPDDGSNEDKLGLALAGGTTGNQLNVTLASHLTSGDSSGARKTTGVRLVDGATLKNSTVRLYSSNVNDGVTVFGSGTVTDSLITAFRDVYQRNATGTVEIRRSALIAVGGGALTEGGTMNIRDSVILNPFGSGDGIFVSSDKGPANVLVDGSTVLGTAGSIGAVVQAVKRVDDSPGVTNFHLNNSIVYGHDFAIAYQEYFPEDTLTLDIDSSAYDSTKLVERVGAGTPQVTIANPVEMNGVDPGFKDPGNGDYSLTAGSPLIDAGQAADPPAGSKDLNGNPRACHGTSSGVIRRDIGAFEYKTDPNDDCVYSVASISDPSGANTDTSRTFTFTSTKAGSTYLCSLDGSAFTACQSPYTAAGLSVGSHELKVRAKDTYGNIQQPAAARSFTTEAPGCGTDPSLCPPDRTPPTVKLISAPKKAKTSRAKIRFSSSEPGSRFTCRVNKGQATKCRSPYKAKLKKGRNVVVIVATDKAGNLSKPKKVKITRK